MNKAGLYIHIPFCKTKCPYCDFYSVPSPFLVPDWLKAVKQEALIYKGRFSRFDSLYLGGGTPSLLNAKELTELVDILFTHFSFSSGRESILPSASILLKGVPSSIVIW